MRGMSVSCQHRDLATLKTWFQRILVCVNVLPDIKISEPKTSQSFLIGNPPRLRRGMRCIRPYSIRDRLIGVIEQGLKTRMMVQGCWGRWLCHVDEVSTCSLSAFSAIDCHLLSAFVFLIFFPSFWEQKEREKQTFQYRTCDRWISLSLWLVQSFNPSATVKMGKIY